MLRLVIEAIALTPIDVPRRETLLRVQWQSDDITELRVDRPSAKAGTGPQAVARMRELAAQRYHDAEIANILNREQVLTATGRPWTIRAVQHVRRDHAIVSRAPAALRPRSLPEVHPQSGLYSIPGAAKLFGVSSKIVRGWIERRLVRVERGKHSGYDTQWLELDAATRAKLRRRIGRSPRKVLTSV
jgi:hypothetical protein